MMFVDPIVVIGAFKVTGSFKANAFTSNGTYILCDVHYDQSCTSTTNSPMNNDAYIYLDDIVKNPSTSPTMFNFLSSNQLQPKF